MSRQAVMQANGAYFDSQELHSPPQPITSLPVGL